VLHGGGAPPGRQQGEVQVDPAVLGDGEGGRREQRAVGHDRAALWGDLSQPGEEVGVTRTRRLEHLEAGVGGPLGHRAGSQLPASAGGRVGPGDDREHLVPRVEQSVEGRDGGVRRAGEDDSHGATCPGRTSGAGSL
jgi:hypothetical protein